MAALVTGAFALASDLSDGVLFADEKFATSAAPPTSGNRCAIDNTCWFECGAGFKSSSKSNSPFSCADLCCPENPVVGTCYVDKFWGGCADDDYRSVAQVGLFDLCCVPGSCFWYKKQRWFGCDCPAGHRMMSHIGTCSLFSADSYALCCPEGNGPDGSTILSHDITSGPQFDTDFDMHSAVLYKQHALDADYAQLYKEHALDALRSKVALGD